MLPEVEEAAATLAAAGVASPPHKNKEPAAPILVLSPSRLVLLDRKAAAAAIAEIGDDDGPNPHPMPHPHPYPHPHPRPMGGH